jgi:hypothetical protein
MSSTVNEFTALWLSSCMCYHILTLHIERAVAELRRLVTSYSREGPKSLPGQSMWDLCCTKWHADMILSKSFSFPCQYHSTTALFCIHSCNLPAGRKWKGTIGLQFHRDIVSPLRSCNSNNHMSSPSNRTRSLEGRQKRPLDGTQTGNKRGFSHAALIFTSWEGGVHISLNVRFQFLTAASMKFRFVFWDVLYNCRPTFQRYMLPPSSGRWVSLARKDL